MKPFTVTVEQLRADGACSDQVSLVKKLYGTAPIACTADALAEAAASGVRIDWLVRYLDASALEAYERVTASAWEAYVRVRASALEAYEHVRASALEAYERETASAREAYERVTASAWEAYERVTASALEADVRVRASALADALARVVK